MKKISTDRIIIVGAGLGALYAALKLAPRPVVIISPEVLGKGASSAWAQGGVAAALGDGDNPDSHAKDTVNAGAGTVDLDVANLVAQAAPEHIFDLNSLGTPFDKTQDGSYVLSREAAHSAARIVRVNGDQAGSKIMAALIGQVRQCRSIQVLEGTLATSLETEDARVTGVVIQSSQEGGSEPVLLLGPATLLAGGGSGGLYAKTTNPPQIRGQVIGMAARAGALIADAEFVQFHPTAMDVSEDPAPLVTEALRGEGAILVNKHNERFMISVHEDAELAPRDVVAHAVYDQTQAGNRPMLDARSIMADDTRVDFPGVLEACLRNGIDPTKQPIPVTAAAHYHMGGVATDKNGRASMGGLWVCGEASSTGLHGANRLASNGLLEALVYASICARDIAGSIRQIDEAELIELDLESGKNVPLDEALSELRQIMTNNVGMVRHEQGLREALNQIERLEAAYSQDVQFLNMCATATLIAASALLREESRGGHYRSDFPCASSEFAKRSQMPLSDALAMRKQVNKDQ